MAIIVSDSCIGIKFLRKNNEQYCTHTDKKTKKYCIHNGKFLHAVIGGIVVHTLNTDKLKDVQYIVFNHAGSCIGGNPNPQHVALTNIIDVKVVPAFNYTYKNFLHPHKYINIKKYCKNSRPGSDYYKAHKNDADKILPTMPIAFCYKNKNGNISVHDGRYMYWQDQTLKRHCVLKLTDKPFRLWYSHMIFDGNANLVPQLRYHLNVTGFKKI